ncbi:hypothetical protein SAMN03159338_1388 [Sphingomonas sp. NFR04]|uniref:hypothetical protein n=1 Tax=Sphingomonas sp. NFR04 TaxID=1566283 RepID=UPI0008E8BE82|nr:hypothetical protein [Sphingomonas sp. NFR04]SFJ31911.1 hypothetical protein SAMN03159338_1388 [Sphingomonas sp. NFR04]
MAFRSTPEDEAIFYAFGAGIMPVLIPGMLLVFGIIYLAMPRSVPPPQSWADGTYVNVCCAPLVLRNGVLETQGRSTRYVVSEAKYGYQLEVPTGIGVQLGVVRFEGSAVIVHFNNDSMARPALREAKSLHLFDLDKLTSYEFVKVR